MVTKKAIKPSISLILLAYVLVIVAAFVYFVIMQQFGYKGLVFHMEGKDQSFTPLDMLIMLSTIVSFVLLLISLGAFGRKKDLRLFVISFAFFFFTIRQFLFLLDNFFPEENIFIGNAVHTLDLLILLSFIMLMYRSKK
jgi:hypothetical protein